MISSRFSSHIVFTSLAALTVALTACGGKDKAAAVVNDTPAMTVTVAVPATRPLPRMARIVAEQLTEHVLAWLARVRAA